MVTPVTMPEPFELSKRIRTNLALIMLLIVVVVGAAFYGLARMSHAPQFSPSSEAVAPVSQTVQ